MRLRHKPWIKAAIEELKDDYVYLGDAAKNKGQWHQLLGKETLAVEIGCGKGNFIVGMAQLHQEQGFVGVETQEEIAYYPAHKAQEQELKNVKIIAGDATDLEEWFEPGEIDMLYLNFSDPWPKARHYKRRLTYRDFLHKYKQLLKPGGHLRFKTDNRPLFDFSLVEFQEFGLEIIALSYDLHHSDYDNPVQTEYEAKFSALGNKINFCEAVFK